MASLSHISFEEAHPFAVTTAKIADESSFPTPLLTPNLVTHYNKQCAAFFGILKHDKIELISFLKASHKDTFFFFQYIFLVNASALKTLISMA